MAEEEEEEDESGEEREEECGRYVGLFATDEATTNSSEINTWLVVVVVFVIVLME